MAFHRSPITVWLYAFLIAIFITTSGCKPISPPVISTPDNPNSSSTAIPNKPSELDAEVVLRVQVPEDTPSGSKLNINILDEVTGLAINARSYRMEFTEEGVYQIKLPLRLGSVIKYRYSLEGTPPQLEYTAHGEPVRYRMCLVTSPLVLQDVITSWSERTASAQAGEIQGVVRDQSNLSPIPGLLVSAGGQQVITSSDGSFEIYGLPEGTHNILVYAMDGSIQPYQQGANVLEGMTTPARIDVISRPRVNLTFLVSIPNENVVGLPVRMAGNLVSLGNTFSDLAGGLSVLGSRMPLLAQQSDGRYSLTLSLPAGTELEYKYTLGDGFWNGELTREGQYNLRKLTVSDHDMTIEDSVATWRSPEFSPITFNLVAPDNTPPGEMISIQFKPFGWTEPVPMWSLGGNRWIYILYNPLNLSGSLEYRFCRNEQCGGTDTQTFASAQPYRSSFTPSTKPQVIDHNLKSWDYWSPSDAPTQVVAAEIQPRGPDFLAGVEFSPDYHATWLPYLGPVYQNLKSINSNLVVLRPTWTYPRDYTPQLTQNPKHDMLWNDLVSTTIYARNQGLNVAYYPSVHFPESSETWWTQVSLTPDWWQAWFDRYRAFLLHHADLATQSGASTLILGGDWLSPALPGGILPDGTSSGVPEDVETRWANLIQEVKQHFSGKLLWAINFPANLSAISPIIADVDAIYLELNIPLTEDPFYTEDSLQNSFSTFTKEQIQPWVEQSGKQAVIALEYPSTTGAAHGCVNSNQAVDCLEMLPIGGLLNISAGIKTDMQAQVDIYNAILGALNGQNWVAGIVSKDYFPPVALQDASPSIHGKPSMDVLWYWFSKMLSPQ